MHVLFLRYYYSINLPMFVCNIFVVSHVLLNNMFIKSKLEHVALGIRYHNIEFIVALLGASLHKDLFYFVRKS